VPDGVHRLPMRGPASMHAAAIANRIDALGATLVIWDGVQAAGGPLGQYTSYESVAMDLEALVGLLPPTTHLMLDHVTGDDLKGGAVPLKARGGTRKVEWARNQWSLILDREKHAEKRHVVGWTHTKIKPCGLPASVWGWSSSIGRTSWDSSCSKNQRWGRSRNEWLTGGNSWRSWKPPDARCHRAKPHSGG